MTEKVSKTSVDYRPADTDQKCRNCSMFKIPGKMAMLGSCTLVEGKIAPEYTCNEWDAK